MSLGIVCACCKLASCHAPRVERIEDIEYGWVCCYQEDTRAVSKDICMHIHVRPCACAYARTLANNCMCTMIMRLCMHAHTPMHAHTHLHAQVIDAVLKRWGREGQRTQSTFSERLELRKIMPSRIERIEDSSLCKCRSTRDVCEDFVPRMQARCFDSED